jgi:RHS repeat-associated protein
MLDGGTTGGNPWLKNVTYYDDKYRVVQTLADNYKGGSDRMTNVVDFVGKVLKTKTTHSTSTHNDLSVTRRFHYDHAGRLLETYHQINSDPEIVITQNTYNELGQLVKKNLHCTNCSDPAVNQASTVPGGIITRSAYNSNEKMLLATQSVYLEHGYYVPNGSTLDAKVVNATASIPNGGSGGTYMQSVDYRYNIRGWLQSMNNSQLTNDGGITNNDTNDLFGFELAYNTPFTTGTTTGNTVQFNGNISAMKWSTNLALNAVKDVAYNYSYDPVNRITGASYLTNNAGAWSNTGAFNENGYAYDLNGNIKSMVRNNSSGTAMDNMTYAYNGNQLLSVTDSGDKTKGFIDGANSGNDYDYDANGNMKYDLNKSLGTSLTDQTHLISYNHLNLPTQIVKNTGEKIIYTYDAGGRKLRQQVYNATGGITRTTDYDGEFIYQGDTLQFINHEEGRVVMKGVTNPEYQYHLKDHLGNVRLTFTTSPMNDSNTATYEDANVNVEQSKFLRCANARRINAAIFDHTNGNSTTTGYSERLNGSSNEKFGLARSISVMPGDVVKAEVYAKYLDPNSTNWSSALNALITQIASNTTGVVVDGAGYGNSTQSFPTNFIGLDSTSDNGVAPRAYLNWLVFDRNYKPLKSQTGFKQITTAAKESGADGPHEYLSSPSITIQQPGYVYIYLSNESSTTKEVYFDDFKVTQNNSPVVQQEDFYPFGLTFNSYTRENAVPQNYLYNGKELQKDLDLNWEDYGARMYMPEIGKFFTEDRYAEKYKDLSPYHYASNNPIKYIDQHGDSLIKVVINDESGYINGESSVLIDHTIFEDTKSIFDAAVETSTPIYINSSFRTNKKQEDVAADPKSTTPAAAGTSAHNAGLALDFNVYKDNDKSKGLESGNTSLTSKSTFIKKVTDKGWRYGGDFTPADKVHIDKKGTDESFKAIRDANQTQVDGNNKTTVDDSKIKRTENITVKKKEDAKQ